MGCDVGDVVDMVSEFESSRVAAQLDKIKAAVDELLRINPSMCGWDFNDPETGILYSIDVDYEGDL